MSESQSPELTGIKAELVPFISGSFAGASGTLLGHPFDSLKVRMQLNVQLDTSALTYGQVMRQLYRGVLPPLLTAGVMQALLFSTYERIKRKLYSIPAFSNTVKAKQGKESFPPAHTPTDGGIAIIGISNRSNSLVTLTPPHFTHFTQEAKSHLHVCMLAGTGGGVVLSFLTTPIGFVKIQQQVSSEASIPAVIKDCYRKGGLRCFYRAFSCMVILEAPGRGVYFGFYEYLKMHINNYKHKVRDGHGHDGEKSMYPLMLLNPNRSFGQGCDSDTNNSNTINTNKNNTISSYNDDLEGEFKEERSTRILAAAVSGIISWAVFYPLDVIKNKMQVDVTRQVHKTTLGCLSSTYREGGIRGLYRGLGYTLIRAGPVAGIVLPFYEYAKEFLESKL